MPFHTEKRLCGCSVRYKLAQVMVDAVDDAMQADHLGLQPYVHWWGHDIWPYVLYWAGASWYFCNIKVRVYKKKI